MAGLKPFSGRVYYSMKFTTMKKLYVPTAALLLLCLSSCAVVKGIFNAGVAVGIIVVVAVIALIIWIASMLKK